MAIQTLSHNYAAIIDELAQVKADIAELARREDALKKQLIELGVGTHRRQAVPGSGVDCVRETLDTKAARSKLEELGVTRQWFQAHTKVAEVTTVRLAACSALAA